MRFGWLRRRIVTSILVLPVVAGTGSVGAQREGGRAMAVTGQWLMVTNLYRATSGLAPVTEDPAASAGAVAHSRYLAENFQNGHEENSKLPFATKSGAKAGLSGNVSSGDDNEREAVEGWMTAPFHALGILDPTAVKFGFGGWIAPPQEDGGFDRPYATMPLFFANYRPAAKATKRVVVWPGDGSGVPLVRYSGGEFPDPMSSCPSFDPDVAGLPIVVRFPTRRKLVRRVVLDVTDPASPNELATCAFDASTYTSTQPQEQAYVRYFLEGNQAVIIPREILVPGHRYQVTIVDSTKAETVSRFRVTDAAIEPVPGSPLTGTPTPGAVSDFSRPVEADPRPSEARWGLRVDGNVIVMTRKTPSDADIPLTVSTAGGVGASATVVLSTTVPAGSVTFRCPPLATGLYDVRLDYGGGSFGTITLNVTSK